MLKMQSLRIFNDVCIQGIKGAHSGLGQTENGETVTTKGEAGKEGGCCWKRALNVSGMIALLHPSPPNSECERERRSVSLAERASAAGVHTSYAQQTSGGHCITGSERVRHNECVRHNERVQHSEVGRRGRGGWLR
jgi:hypothetical protein